MAFHGTSYGYSAEVASKHKAKYDPAMESAIKRWLEGLTRKNIGPNFQAGLKDGVIICEAINALKPGTVRKINTGTMPFKCMENIQNFLAGCRTFGIVDADLFAVVDLYEAKNMTLVLQGLHALARKDSRFVGPSGSPSGNINNAPSQQPSYGSASRSGSQPTYGSSKSGSQPTYGSSKSGSSGSFVPSPSSGYNSSGSTNESNSTSGNLYGAKYGSSGASSSPNRQPSYGSPSRTGGSSNSFVPSPSNSPQSKGGSGGLYGAVYGKETSKPSTSGSPKYSPQSSPTTRHAPASPASSGPKFCPTCGTKRDPPSSKFCGECGFRF